jgi:chromate reductase
MISAAHTRFDADGKLTDEATRTFLASFLIALRDWTFRLQRGA